jgi:hypothetical protein
MKLQVRYRTIGWFALAISLLIVAGVPQLAGAESRRADAPGQVKKAPASEPAASSSPSSGTPTAADHPEDYSKHDADSGPGGQVCDGDPDNEPGAGGKYENTCPAGPSQNGAGDGNANGKPCAGCVGNADDKNPKGQADSGPNDHNNGYECDQKGRSDREGNNGIGFGNPAHTGCEGSPPPPPPTCPNGKPMPASGNTADCDPKCPNGKPMPASGNTADCDPKCPNGKPMPASGNTADCDPKCPNGKSMPASGNTADCDPKCPNGDAMPASGNVADCNVVTTQGGPTVVVGEVLARPVEVLGVQLSAPAAAPAALARTGGLQLVGLFQAAIVLALLGLGLTVGARWRRSSGMIDIATRLGG